MKDFNNYYITSCGKVWNYKLNRFIAQRVDKNGYKIVTMFDDYGKRHDFKVHRLVAMEYIPNPSNLETVDHINGVKTDNYVNNLQWMTRGDNSNKSHCRKVLCVETNEAFESYSAAARKYGVSPASIHSAASKGHRCRNLHWEVIE